MTISNSASLHPHGPLTQISICDWHSLPQKENISVDCKFKPNQRQCPPIYIPSAGSLKPIGRLPVISLLFLLSATLHKVIQVGLCASNIVWHNWNAILSNVDRQAQEDKGVSRKDYADVTVISARICKYKADEEKAHEIIASQLQKGHN